MAKISAYFAWIDTSATLPVVEVDGLFGVGLEVAGPPELVPLRAVEFTFATCWAKARGLTRPGDTPARIDAAAPAPRDVARLEGFFGCPLRFAAGANRMLFKRAVWEHRCPSADPSLLIVLEQHARTLVEAIEREPGVVGEVRRALYAGGPTPSLGEVAQRLGLSTRTLQRRLRQAETPFADLAASVREELARRLLAERRLALAEVAFVLGFADQSSFTRSFKRWTGRTPAAFRAAP